MKFNILIIVVGLIHFDFAHAGAGASVEAKSPQEKCERRKGGLKEVENDLDQLMRTSQGALRGAAKGADRKLKQTVIHSKAALVTAKETTVLGLETVGKKMGSAAESGAEFVRQVSDHPVTKDLVKIGVNITHTAKSAASAPSIHINFNYTSHQTTNHFHFHTQESPPHQPSQGSEEESTHN